MNGIREAAEWFDLQTDHTKYILRDMVHLLIKLGIPFDRALFQVYMLMKEKV